jgi:transketolase
LPANPNYRDPVLPPTVKARVAAEAGIGMGWERYTGSAGAVFVLAGCGASAPGEHRHGEVRVHG